MAVLLGRYKSSLAAAVAIADTTIEVASVSGLPVLTTGDHYYLTITRGAALEVIKVTAQNGTRLTVQRAQSSTSALLWAAGATVALTNDPVALIEAMRQEAAQVDQSDEPTILAAIQQRIDQGLDAQIDQRIDPAFRANRDWDNEESIDELEPGDRLIAQDETDDVKKRVSPGVLSERVKDDILPDGEPNKYLGWDEGGTTVVNKDAPEGSGSTSPSTTPAGLSGEEVNDRIRSYIRNAAFTPAGQQALAAAADKWQPSTELAKASATTIHADLPKFVEFIAFFGSDRQRWQGTTRDETQLILDVQKSAETENFAKTTSEDKVPTSKQGEPADELQGAQIDRTADDILALDASRTGDKHVKIPISELQSSTVESWAQPGTSAKVPVSRLPSQALQSGGNGGLNQAAVDARVRAADNAATESERGNVELATDAEVTSGESDKVPTAAQLKSVKDDIPTDAEIEGIASREDTPIDVIAEFDDLTGARTDTPGAPASESRIGPGTFNVNLGEFTVDGTIFVLRQVYTRPQDDRGEIEVTLTASTGNTEATAAKLRNAGFAVNGVRASFKDAEIVTDASWINWSWNNRYSSSSDPITRDGNNTVTFFDGLDEENYVPGGSTDGQLLSSDGAPEWRGLGTGLRWLNKALTLTAAYAARLLPTGGTSGEVLKRTSTGYEWTDDLEGAIPRGQNFPASPAENAIWELTHSETIPDDHYLQAHALGNGITQILVGGGAGLPSAILFYDSTYTGTGQATLRTRAVIQYGGTRDKTADQLIFYTRTGDRTAYSVESNNAGTGLEHFYLANQSLTDGDVSDEAWYFVNIRFTDGSYLYPDIEKSRGVFVYTSSDGWQLSPRFPASWARQGQPYPGLRGHERALLDGEGPGINVADVNTSHNTTLQRFTPDFDLGATANRYGIIFADLRLYIATRSANTVGFDIDGLRSIRIEGFKSNTALRTSTAYSASTANGLEIDSVTVYNGQATVGTVKLYYAIDAANLGGVYGRWETGAGAGSETLAIQINGQVIEVPQDGEAPTEAFTDLSDTPNDYEGSNGKPLVGNSAEDGLVFGEFPTGGGGGNGGFSVPDLYDIGLAAASGGTPHDAGPPLVNPVNGVNRKYVEAAAGGVVEDDWSVVSLTANATPVQGVTISGNEIVFAQARRCRIMGSIETTLDSSGGASRLYAGFHLVKVGTPDQTLYWTTCSNYHKMTHPDSSEQASLTQGPRAMDVHIDMEIDAGAGDRYRIEWAAYLQTGDKAEIVRERSGIKMRFYA